MKRPIILSSIALCGLYLVLGSNAAGPASSGNGIRTGGPGSTSTCTACHGGGSGTTTASLSLKVKATGAAVSGSYTPGIVYTVTISGNNTNLSFFGFQVTATQGAAQSGAFSNLGSDKHISNIGGLQVVEHSTSLAKTGGGYEASFDWTAPAAGAGTVVFSGIINGVNKDNNTTGDKVSEPASLSLTEGTVTSIAEKDSWSNLKLSPVPASDMLKLNSEGISAGAYTFVIYDLNGKAMWKGAGTAQNDRLQAEIPVRQLAAGTYFLNIQGRDSKATRIFQKQ